MSKPFFHEAVTPAVFDQMKSEHMTWAQVAEKYAQPTWCTYPDAISPMGCWSLLGFAVKDEAFCANCSCHARNASDPAFDEGNPATYKPWPEESK